MIEYLIILGVINVILTGIVVMIIRNEAQE